MNLRSSIFDCRKIFGSIPKRRQWQFLLLFALMILSAMAEVVSLGAVIPFLGILSDPEQAIQQPLVSKLIDWFGLGSGNELRFQLTALFTTTAIIAGLVRFVLIYVTARVNFGMVHEIGSEVYRRTLCQPYSIHIQRNSSEIIGAIGKVDVVHGTTMSLLTMTSSILMAVSIVATLIYIDPLVSLAALIGLGAIYTVISLATRKRLNRNSRVINQAYGSRVKTIQEGMGGVRDIILDHSQGIFAEQFDRVDWPMRKAQASTSIIDSSPRFGIEALGMVLIASLAYALTIRDGTLASVLPVLGALALGAQRLMPLIQGIYRSFVFLAGNQKVSHEVAKLLQQPIAKELETAVELRPFKDIIELANVSFRYQPESPEVLKNLSLTIPKGSRVGFVGETGCGKSTLIDLIMGLLQPTTGRFLVDGAEIDGAARLGWQQNIAHVPQSIFLRDASFVENIAFGVPKAIIDLERVKTAAAQSQIADFIEKGPQGYAGIVGERGVRLSGGQRQRIGIARALYKNSQVLILDEATSALDAATEAAVIKSVLSTNPELTVLMIAHRLSTLDECDFIVKIQDGQVESTQNNPDEGRI